MATLANLNLGDSGPGREQASNRLAAERFAQHIEDLLGSGEYGFASETLEGIHETVIREGRVTPGQEQAVATIERTRGARRSTYERQARSRRYEGWRR